MKIWALYYQVTDMFEPHIDLENQWWTKLVDGRTKLVGGWTKLVDGRTKLVDGRTKLVDGQTKLVDGRTKLVDGRTNWVQYSIRNGEKQEYHISADFQLWSGIYLYYAKVKSSTIISQVLLVDFLRKRNSLKSNEIYLNIYTLFRKRLHRERASGGPNWLVAGPAWLMVGPNWMMTGPNWLVTGPAWLPKWLMADRNGWWPDQTGWWSDRLRPPFNSKYGQARISN